MDFVVGELQPTDADVIEGWRYEPPYDFYDIATDPEDRAALRLNDPAGEYFYAVRSSGRLTGFFSVILEDEAVRIGLALRPDLTGAGLGESFVRAGLRFALARYEPATFRLMVAAFNERARLVYERVGFTETGRIMRTTRGAEWEFILMQMPAAALGSE